MSRRSPFEDERFEREGTRLRVDSGADSRNLAGEHPVWIRVDLQLDGLTGLDPGRQSLGNLRGHLQRIDAHDAHDRHLRLDQLAERDDAPLDMTVERRPDAGVAELTFGELGGGVGRIHVRRHVLHVLKRQVVAGLLGSQRGFGIVECLLRHELTFVELAGAFEVLARLIELCRRAFHIGRLFGRRQLAGFGRAVASQRPRQRGALLIEVVLKLLAIELDEDLARGDPVAEVGQNPADDAFGLRRHGDFVLGRERAADVDGSLDLVAPHACSVCTTLPVRRAAGGLRAGDAVGAAGQDAAEHDGNQEVDVDADEEGIGALNVKTAGTALLRGWREDPFAGDPCVSGQKRERRAEIRERPSAPSRYEVLARNGMTRRGAPPLLGGAEPTSGDAPGQLRANERDSRRRRRAERPTGCSLSGSGAAGGRGLVRPARPPNGLRPPSPGYGGSEWGVGEVQSLD